MAPMTIRAKLLKFRIVSHLSSGVEQRFRKALRSSIVLATYLRFPRFVRTTLPSSTRPAMQGALDAA